MTLSRNGTSLGEPAPATGWAFDYLVQPTPMAGSNGLRLGPDGALYVAECNAGHIGRVDLTTGEASVVNVQGDAMTGPDDLAFDSRGNMFITEVMGHRVSMRRPDGTLSVIAGETPCANGITVHGDRIFMSEFNPEGRILELSADGSAPRTIASGLMMPNALQLGPDGLIYFPLVPLGEIWRASLDGKTLERVTGGLVMPTGAKFDSQGRLWAVEAATGALIRIDVQSGDHVQKLQVAPGADNFVFGKDGQIFVSHFTDGQIVQITMDGVIDELVAPGMLGPFGVTVTAGGQVIAADGGSLAAIGADGKISRVSQMIEHGSPGYARGIAVDADGSLLISNTAGNVARFTPGGEARFLAEGLDQLMGIAPDGQGGAYVCEAGTGRVLAVGADGSIRTVAQGLNRPADVQRLGDGSLAVSEAGTGRLLALSGDSKTVILDGLAQPHGVTATAEGLFVLDYGASALHLVPADGAPAHVVARDLPVGNSFGRGLQGLPGIEGILPGPILAFGSIAATPDGDIVIGADAVGGIARVARQQTRH